MKKLLSYSVVLLLLALTLVVSCNANIMVENPKPPKFSVESKQFTDSFDVILSCDTKDAKISYTTDGKEPDVNKAQSSPLTITVDKTMTIKAIVVKDGLKSEVASVFYVKTDKPDRKSVV